jgi:hypothetical protein
MSKPTQTHKQEMPAAPPSQKKQPAPAPPPNSPLPRPAAAKEVPTPRSPSAAGQRPTQEQIAARAYQLWERKGKPAGTDRDDWYEAERLLTAEAR